MTRATLKTRLYALLTLLFFSQSCGVYTFSGASIPPDMNTVSVQFFENTSALVVPYLSQDFTEELKNRIRNQTRLSIVRTDGDANFEGRISDYSVRPVAIQGNERAGLTRITVTVMVKYTNVVDPALNFEESFSAFQEFSLTGGSVQAEEQRLIPIINKQLSELIFNRAFANW